VQLEISGTDDALNLPGFPLHPLPSLCCEARARSCLPVEGGGPPPPPPPWLALFLPERPLAAGPCSGAGARCSAGLNCPAILCFSAVHPPPRTCFSEACWQGFPYPCLVQTRGQELSGVVHWMLCHSDRQEMLGPRHTLVFAWLRRG